MLKKNLFFYIVFTIILCVQYNYAQNYSNLLRTNNKAFKKTAKIKYTPLNYISFTKQMFGDNSLTGVTDVEFVGSNCYVLTTGSASSKNKIYKFKNYNFTDFTKISSNIQKSNLQSGWYELSVKHNKLIVGEKNKIYFIDTTSLNVVDSLQTALNSSYEISGIAYNPKDNSYFIKAFTMQYFYPAPTNLYQISQNGVVANDFLNDYPTVGLAIDTLNNVLWQSSQIGDESFSVHLSLFDLASYSEVTSFVGVDPWNNKYGFAQGATIIYNYPGHIGKPILVVTYNIPDPANDVIGGVVFYELENVPAPVYNLAAEEISNSIKISWELPTKTLTNKNTTIDSIIIFKNNKKLVKINSSNFYTDNTQTQPEILYYSVKVYANGKASPIVYANKLPYHYILAEDFESYNFGSIPDNWTKYDLNQDNSTWSIYDWPVHSGYYALYIENKPGSIGIKNDICVTNKFYLDKNKTYLFSAYAMTLINSQDKLAFVLLNNATFSQTNVLSYIKDTLWINDNFGDIQYKNIQILYQPKESGYYNLGIWALTNSPNSFNISVDDIYLKEATNLSNFNKPQNVKATYYLFNKVRVQWDVPEYSTYNLEKYLIYRNGLLYDSTTTNKYFDKNVIAEKYYSYYVIAKYTQGNSEPSNTVFGYSYDGTYPSNLKATNKNTEKTPYSRVILSFNAAPAVADTALDVKKDFIGYIIYRNGNKYDTIKSLDQTVYYFDRNVEYGQNYKYKVSALFSYKETNLTNEVEGNCLDGYAPTELTASLDLTDNIQLNWKYPVKAYNNAEGFEDYSVPSSWTTTPKLNWNIIDNDKDKLTWFLVSDLSNSGNMSIACYSRKPSGNFPAITSDDYLITKDKITIPANSKLKFWLYSFVGYENEKLNIKVGSDISNLNSFQLVNSITKNSSGWQAYEIDLSNFANQNLYIALQHISSTTDTKVYALLVDDIELTGYNLLNYTNVFTTSENKIDDNLLSNLKSNYIHTYSINKVENIKSNFVKFKIYSSNNEVGEANTNSFQYSPSIFGKKIQHYINAVYDDKISSNSNIANGMAFKSTQIIEKRDFENYMMPGGWKVLNLNNDSYQWRVLKSADYNKGIGKYFLGLEGATNTEPNDWVFTKGYQLQKDDTLQLAFYYSCNYLVTTYGSIVPVPQTLSVFLNSAQDANSIVFKIMTLENFTNYNMNFIDTVVKIPHDGTYYIGFKAHSPASNYSSPSNLLVLDNILTYHYGSYPVGINNENKKKYQFNLSQNYPNPFNPTTKIKFTIPENSKVKLTLYNTLGQLLSTLVDDNLNIGEYDFNLNMNNFATGVYYYKIDVQTNNGKYYSDTKKMILIK